jgi:hypothetical protein
VTSGPAETQRLRDLARLRRVRDRIDREYAQPLDVEAPARGVKMSAAVLATAASPRSVRGRLLVAGHVSTRFTELVGVPRNR